MKRPYTRHISRMLFVNLNTFLVNPFKYEYEMIGITSLCTRNREQQCCMVIMDSLSFLFP